MIAYLLCFALATHGAEPTNRTPVPSDAQQKAVLKLIGEVFREEYDQAKTPAQKLELAKKMLEAGKATMDDPASRYILFRLAKDITSQHGDLDTALAAIEFMGEFELDKLELQVGAMKAAAKQVRKPKEYHAFADQLAKLTDEAIAADQYEHAKALATLLLTAERSGRDAARLKLAMSKSKEIDAVAAEFEKVKLAKITLETKPTDPAANLIVGKFLCLVKSDWERGMPMLALGNDPAINQLAIKTLNQDDASLEVADGWWKLASSLKGMSQTNMRRYAATYYEQLLPKLAGLTKTRVEKQLEELEASSKAGKPTVKLPPPKFLRELIVEARVDCLAELHITPSGVHWKSLEGFSKPGKHRSPEEPTYLNGVAWYPEWGKPSSTSGRDESKPVAVPIGKLGFSMQIVAISTESRRGGILQLTEFPSLRDEGDTQVLSIPDKEGSSRWYTIRLYRK